MFKRVWSSKYPRLEEHDKMPAIDIYRVNCYSKSKMHF